MTVKSIFRIALPKYVVRVYRDEDANFEFSQSGFTPIELAAYKNQDLPLMELARKILEMPNVSSVEVINWDNNGVRIDK